MPFDVKLDGEFTVRAGGQVLPPPNQAVAVLLVGLALRGGEWTRRSDLARLLYPESDSAAAANAFRQSLHRLKQWLGQGVIEQKQNCVRLMPGQFRVSHAAGAVLAPGVSHPWLDAIRNQAAPHPVPVTPIGLDFVSMVEKAAGLDREAGRKLLIGGGDLAENLPVSEVSRLLDQTQPKDRRDPFALEHLELRALVNFTSGLIMRARSDYYKAFSFATYHKRRTAMARTAAMALFATVEAGDLAAGREWLGCLEAFDRVSSLGLLIQNARAAYLWSSNNLTEAMQIMVGARGLVSSADRIQRLHYWTNLAVLASEAGEAGVARNAEENALSVSVPDFDARLLLTLRLSSATQLMRIGMYDESIGVFQALSEKAAESGFDYIRWYAAEGLAETLARAGDTDRARSTWKSAESTRRSAGIRLTPRLTARKSAIMSLC